MMMIDIDEVHEWDFPITNHILISDLEDNRSL
jgi:hypothetical protein